MTPSKLKFPNYWDEGFNDLCASDPILAKIAIQNKEIKLYSHRNVFLTLVRAIVSQQISSQAAEKISYKLLFLISLESCTLTRELNKVIDASTFLRSKSCFKRLGISQKKYTTMNTVAHHLNNNKDYWKNLNNFSDVEILSELTNIKGIGVWTGQMFLIFHLMRPNVLPETDFGLLKSIMKNYSLPDILSAKQQLPKLKEKWAPWNTIATWYLWCDIDPRPFIY